MGLSAVIATGRDGHQSLCSYCLASKIIVQTEMTLPDRSTVSRRQYLKAAVALGGVTGLAACLEELDGESSEAIPTGDPSRLPTRQHAWNEVLRTDDDGNTVPPKHHVLRYVDLADGVDPAAARRPFADALAALEDAIAWGPEGLLFTIGYSPAYFDRFDEPLADSVDLPEPTQLTDLEPNVSFDNVDLLVHLASDRPDILLEAEEGLFGDSETVNGVDVPSVDGLVSFPEYDRRTGFVGAGLPADRQDVRGVDGQPVPEAAPFFMGYRSGFARTQATEDRVTIESGPFAEGTTQQVSKLHLQLNAWYGQESHSQRVSKTFSPRHAEEGLVDGVGENLTDDSGILPKDFENIIETARADGVVGHAQKAARAREDGEPIILRRDFNTTDDEQAGVHFLSLQEGIADFVAVRDAMTGEEITENAGGIGRRLNNGILQYVFVRRRGNFLLPPRASRSMPTPTGAE